MSHPKSSSASTFVTVPRLDLENIYEMLADSTEQLAKLLQAGSPPQIVTPNSYDTVGRSFTLYVLSPSNTKPSVAMQGPTNPTPASDGKLDGTSIYYFDYNLVTEGNYSITATIAGQGQSTINFVTVDAGIGGEMP